MSYTLVISRDASCRRLCVDNLVRRGYVAAGVASALEAENLLQAAPPDLVLLYCMSGEYETEVEFLRTHYHLTGALVLISRDKPDRAWAVRFGVTVCLADPIDTRRLVHMLQPWLPPRGVQAAPATA